MPNPTTPLFGSPLIPPGGTAQDETLHNEALLRHEVVTLGRVLGFATAPTGDELVGDAYIVAASGAEDEFEGQENKVAYKRLDEMWDFIPGLDSNGLEMAMSSRLTGAFRFYNADTVTWWHWNDDTWVEEV